MTGLTCIFGDTGNLSVDWAALVNVFQFSPSLGFADSPYDDAKAPVIRFLNDDCLYRLDADLAFTQVAFIPEQVVFANRPILEVSLLCRHGHGTASLR